MQVRANSMGFIRGRRYREGAIFDWPSTAPLGKWVTPVGVAGDAAPKAAPAPKTPAKPASKAPAKALDALV